MDYHLEATQLNESQPKQLTKEDIMHRLRKLVHKESRCLSVHYDPGQQAIIMVWLSISLTGLDKLIERSRLNLSLIRDVEFHPEQKDGVNRIRVKIFIQGAK